MTSAARFLVSHPGYAATRALDELRAAEYGRLDARGTVYLDYTGGGLHAESQVLEHTALLNEQVFGNPHSASPSSTAMTNAVERARAKVLDYFNGTGSYTAVFTLNASGALKLIGESYPFELGGRLLMTVDNHNSVNGIREFAAAKGAAVDYAPLTVPELRIDEPALLERLGHADRSRSNLFAFPAQSNFSGVRHPLALVGAARERGWDVLVDAAAFVPTNRLDLQAIAPDFAVVSFYKMFGYPTGVGCLLIRDAVLHKLRRPWFAGGTVAMNVYDANGAMLDFRRVEELAAQEGISLRTGCFCNPGAGETAEGLTEDDMRAGLAEGADITLPRFLQVMQQRGGKSLGAVRVSLGLVSNIADVDRFLAFAAGFRDQTLTAVGALTVDDANCRVIRDGS